eukprot:4579392-Lingulodinium_polyedra.AAC.1
MGPLTGAKLDRTTFIGKCEALCSFAGNGGRPFNASHPARPDLGRFARGLRQLLPAQDPKDLL